MMIEAFEKIMKKKIQKLAYDTWHTVKVSYGKFESYVSGAKGNKWGREGERGGSEREKERIRRNFLKANGQKY